MKSVHGIIYSARNIINNKRYIGQTVRSLERRKREHISNANRGGQYAFHQAIRKYGEENFKWRILDTAETIEELDKKEIYWINYYDTYGHGGYNMAVGGQHNKSEYSDLDKLSEQFGGREFYIFDLKGNFIKETRSQSVFANKIMVNPTSVNDVLKGKKNQVKGYVLIFKENFNNNLLKEKLELANDNLSNKEFYVFNKNDCSFIGKWNNRMICHNELNVSTKTITRNLKLNNKNSRSNYLFYFKDDIPDNLLEKLNIDKLLK